MMNPTIQSRRSRAFPTLVLAATLVFIGGCKDASGPGSSGVTFPTISASDLALYCIRGQAVPPTTVNGSITSGDCNDGGNDGYYETWHVRVASSGSVTFSASSSFDNYLELVRVDDVSDIAGSAVLIDFDDDSGSGLNATLTATLQVNTDYAIVVSGFDDSETGSYTLTMTQ